MSTTVSDKTHRPEQRVNLFMSTGLETPVLNHMCHNVQDTFFVASDRAQALDPDRTGISESPNKDEQQMPKDCERDEYQQGEWRLGLYKTELLCRST
jgi:hypothetical protein